MVNEKISEDDISNIVREIICDKLGVDKDRLTAESDFKNDLGVDSLDMIELQMEFEKKFDISIPDEEVEKLSTMGEMIAYIKERRIF